MLEAIVGYLGVLGTILMETGVRLGMTTNEVANSSLSGYGAASASTMVFNVAFAPLVAHLGPLLQQLGAIFSAL